MYLLGLTDSLELDIETLYFYPFDCIALNKITFPITYTICPRFRTSTGSVSMFRTIEINLNCPFISFYNTSVIYLTKEKRERQS